MKFIITFYFVIVIIVAFFGFLAVKNFVEYREAQLNCAVSYMEDGSAHKECDK